MRRGCRLQYLIGRGYGNQFISLVVHVIDFIIVFFGLFPFDKVSVVVATGSEPPIPEGAHGTSAGPTAAVAVDVVGIVRHLPVHPLPPVVSHPNVPQGYPDVPVFVHDDGVEVRDLLRRRWAGLNGDPARPVSVLHSRDANHLRRQQLQVPAPVGEGIRWADALGGEKGAEEIGPASSPSPSAVFIIIMMCRTDHLFVQSRPPSNRSNRSNRSNSRARGVEITTIQRGEFLILLLSLSGGRNGIQPAAGGRWPVAGGRCAGFVLAFSFQVAAAGPAAGSAPLYQLILHANSCDAHGSWNFQERGRWNVWGRAARDAYLLEES